MADIPVNRRKSCGACAKGKRRCDMRLPRCQRCAKKNINCKYPGIKSSLAETTIPELDFPWLEKLLDTSTTSWTGQLAEQSVRLRESLSSDTDLLPQPDFLPYEGPTQTSLAQQEMTFALHQFKTFPEKWVKVGKAPFIHPQLYASNMPRALQDAYAACAIYSTKTDQNATVAFTVIESKANELLRSSPTRSTTWTPLELLAAVQGLLIFQIIRLFDGDIRQRTLAEEAEPVLDKWTQDLKERTEKEILTTTANAASWRAWLFAESVRRTIIMSYNLKGIYSLVKHGHCTMGTALTSLSFTAQQALWAASSNFEWSAAVRDNFPLWVQNMQFDSIIQDGKGWDIDDFGIVMMVMFKGRDRIDEWLASGNAERNAVFNPDLFQTMIETMPGEAHPDIMQHLTFPAL